MNRSRWICLLALLIGPVAWSQDTPEPSTPIEAPDDGEAAPDASASEPASDAAPAPVAEPAVDAPAEEKDDGRIDLEIEVISEAAVAAAREDVVRKMKEMGWKARRRVDGMVIFKGPEAWMGKAKLFPTGDIQFTTPLLAVNGPRETQGTDGVDRGFDNDVQSGTVGIDVAPAISKKKIRAAQQDIKEGIQPLVIEYRQKIQQRYFAGYIADIPARLDALWTDGVSLDGFSTVASYEDRRAEALDMWASRLDSDEGRIVMRTIELWLRNTVQDSPHPVTPEEIKAAEERRTDGRTLDLE